MKLELLRLEFNPGNIQNVQKVLENAQDYLLKVSGEVAGPNDGEDVFQEMPENFDPNSKHVVGMFLDGKMIGAIDFLIGYPESHIAYLGLLVFAEDHQRKGLGKEAFAKFEEYLSTYSSISIIRLAVLETNKSVMAFWEKCGFRPSGVVKPFTNKKVISQAIIMEKSFP